MLRVFERGERAEFDDSEPIVGVTGSEEGVRVAESFSDEGVGSFLFKGVGFSFVE